MGKMKELFIDLQDQYGIDLENLPVEFSYDEFLAQKSREISNKSDCCGVDMNQIATNDGATWLDLGICPKCFESCC